MGLQPTSLSLIPWGLSLILLLKCLEIYCCQKIHEKLNKKELSLSRPD